MTTISISIDDDLLEWLDQLLADGTIKNRSEAVRGGIFTYIKEQIGIPTREKLREFLDERKSKPFQDGVVAIRHVRDEE